MIVIIESKGVSENIVDFSEFFCGGVISFLYFIKSLNFFEKLGSGVCFRGVVVDWLLKDELL